MRFMTEKSKKNYLILAAAIVIIVAAALIFHFNSGVKLYDSDTITGNTSGNLLNGGLFCQSGKTIYFANPYDENTLYSMDADLSHVKKLSKDNVSYLNVAQNYMFYTKRNDKKELDSDAFLALSSTGLYRANTKGSSIARLYDDPTQVACLYGNNIYYQHYDQKKGLLLYAASIDGKKDKLLLEEPCAPTAVDNNTIYFTGSKNDHSIHSMNLDGSGNQILLDGNFAGLSKQGEYLYFLDMNANYSLKRMPASGGNVETLISDQLATYNVSQDGNTVYCQIDNGSKNGLYALDIPSMSLQRIASGNYNYLHLTSDYLFYEEFDQSKLYVMNLGNSSTKELKLK